MTKLYLIRHGETYFNVWHKIQGWCDSPLTSKGKMQALAAKQYFVNHKIKFDHAYCSTSERTSDTLELITQHPYQRKKGLKEWYFGSFEGQDERLNPQPPYGNFFVQYGGESQNDVQKRVFNTINEIMINAKTNDKILIVSHAGACFNFLNAIGINPRILLNKHFGNCSILVINYQNDKYQLDQIVNPEENIE